MQAERKTYRQKNIKETKRTTYRQNILNETYLTFKNLNQIEFFL